MKTPDQLVADAGLTHTIRGEEALIQSKDQCQRRRLKPAQGLKSLLLQAEESEEAGGGNRTHDNSLEDCSFTIKLRPQTRSGR